MGYDWLTDDLLIDHMFDWLIDHMINWLIDRGIDWTLVCIIRISGGPAKNSLKTATKNESQTKYESQTSQVLKALWQKGLPEQQYSDSMSRYYRITEFQ